VPDVAGSVPVKIRIVVVLPEPDGPMTPSSAPSRTASDKSATAVLPLKRFVTESMKIVAPSAWPIPAATGCGTASVRTSGAEGGAISGPRGSRSGDVGAVIGWGDSSGSGKSSGVGSAVGSGTPGDSRSDPGTLAEPSTGGAVAGSGAATAEPRGPGRSSMKLLLTRDGAPRSVGRLTCSRTRPQGPGATGA
jgi:hypothetical protein